MPNFDIKRHYGLLKATATAGSAKYLTISDYQTQAF
jgi:hypothetical protein